MFDTAFRLMTSWWRSKKGAPSPDDVKPSFHLRARLASAEICGWPLPEGMRIDAGGIIIVDHYQELAERLCKRMFEQDEHEDFEPPDLHMHPEPMPFDYNDWNDHMGRHVIRHNYH